MSFEFFKIRVCDPGQEQTRLNAFLRAHRILAVRQEWVAEGAESFWAFSVDYHDGNGTANSRPDGVGKTGRIDYREVLDAPDFILFAKLRDLRKIISDAEGVPSYAIFTNEQLAAMVQGKCRSLADLKGIAGIGDGRAGKYGERFLALLAAEQTDEP